MKFRFVSLMVFFPVLVGIAVMMAAINLGTHAYSLSLSILSLSVWVLGEAFWLATRIAVASEAFPVMMVAWLGWYPPRLISWTIIKNQFAVGSIFGAFVLLALGGWIGSSYWLRSRSR